MLVMKKKVEKSVSTTDVKQSAFAGFADLMSAVSNAYETIEKSCKDERFVYFLTQDVDDVWIVVDRRTNNKTRYSASDLGRSNAMDFIVMNQCLR